MAPIVVELTPDEALVLFEVVQRFSNSDILSANDAAERQVFWNLCCLLEKQSLIESPTITLEEAVRDAKARLVE